MKSIIFGALALSFLLSINVAQACTVNSNAPNAIIKVVQEHGGWPIDDKQCGLLKNNHLQLIVNGDSDTFGDVNAAWAFLQLGDTKQGIVSVSHGNALAVSHGPISQEASDNELYKAIEASIKQLQWNRAVKEVNHFRSIVRKH